MYSASKFLISNRILLKVCSFITGYLLWLMIAYHHAAIIHITVPLCFYNTHGKLLKNAPEKVTVVLRSTRNILAALDLEQLALHIDAQHLREGKQCLAIHRHHLLLPSQVTFLHTIPANILIDIQQVQK